MPLISFSGKSSQGSFYQQILDGKKTQTCRKPRKHPIKKGDILYLYWKCRVPKNKKPIHFIGEAVCIEVERQHYKDFAYLNYFAKCDGFRDHLELQEWFGDPISCGMEEYDVISFKLK